MWSLNRPAGPPSRSARIAREMHDVVAHSMSIVHIQAESARYRVTDVEEARGEFNDIARSARSALSEMRQLLAALHPDDDDAYYAPQPSTDFTSQADTGCAGCANAWRCCMATLNRLRCPTGASSSPHGCR